MKAYRTVEFIEWFRQETPKAQAQIAVRVKNIEESEHFGDHKYLGNSLAELRWKNGRRVYFTIYHDGDATVLLLLGGYKNAQIKDIQKARRLLEKYVEAQKIDHRTDGSTADKK